jgi:hypothetical protein
MSFDTSVGYHWVNHRFCIDIATFLDKDDDFAILITENVKLIECSKVLIDYLLDFGQYAPWDTNSPER